MLLVVLVASWFLLLASTYKSVSDQVTSVLLLGANVHLYVVVTCTRRVRQASGHCVVSLSGAHAAGIVPLLGAHAVGVALGECATPTIAPSFFGSPLLRQCSACLIRQRLSPPPDSCACALFVDA